LTAEEAYRKWLFHGPSFQCIEKIEGISEHGIIASVLASSPGECLTDNAADQWLIDPIVADSGPQLAILWARATRDMTALPSHFQSYHRYGALSGPHLRCYFQALSGAGEHVLRANIFFINSDGRLAGLLEGLESTCSKSLNRLAGASSGHPRGNL
jgi:hypothetical protein